MVVEQQAAWTAALERAHRERIAVTIVERVTSPRFDRTTAAVTSASGHTPYLVTVTANAGGIFATCSCPAGQHEHTCKHVAITLETLNLLGTQAQAAPCEDAAPRPHVNGAAALARLQGNMDADPWAAD